MKGQFSGLLYDTGFVHSRDPTFPDANVNSGNIKLVIAVLCAGLYPNVAKIEQKKPNTYVDIHMLAPPLRSKVITPQASEALHKDRSCELPPKVRQLRRDVL